LKSTNGAVWAVLVAQMMRNSSNSLIERRRRQALTSREVAEVLAVSESSVKRWCDSGRLRTAQTPGSHRRIPVEAVLELARRGGPSVQHPALLGATEVTPPRSHAAARRELVRALLCDDEAAARKILKAHRRASSGFDVVADEVVAPAASSTGVSMENGTRQRSSPRVNQAFPPHAPPCRDVGQSCRDIATMRFRGLSSAHSSTAPSCLQLKRSPS
jgi:excisionase family DNA binding protein